MVIQQTAQTHMRPQRQPIHAFMMIQQDVQT
jgi:hypothetical protein